MKKNHVITGLVFIITGAAFAFTALVLARFDFSKFDSTNYVKSAYASTDIFDKINIDTEEFDIIFTPSTNNKLNVEC